MSIIGSNIIAGASGQAGYNLNNSLRFRLSNSAQLSRTPTVAGNRRTFTKSFWIKRGASGDGTGTNHMFLCNQGGAGQEGIDFYQNTIRIEFGGGTYELQTTQVLRDYSAWYHIVWAIDTTQATSTNRVKIYVNGVQVTAFTTANYPAQNFDCNNNNTVAHHIGFNNNSNYFDGYMTEIYNIDGQQLTPSSFGETSATTGQWIPKKYTGTYGTNGFYLKGRGTDNSGNGNNWTENNFNTSNSALTTYDIMLDVPTNTSATVGNYCVLNPLDTGSNITLSAANLQTSQGASAGISKGTIGISSGKWYWEVTLLSGTTAVGIADITSSRTQSYVGQTSTSYGYYSGNGNKYNNATGVAYGASYTTNDVIGVALDMDAGTLTFYKNNTSQGTAYSSLSGTFTPAIGNDQSNTTAFNAGQRPFTYTAPSGFVALNTYNLPTPTILQGNKYMDATLWTGDQTTRTITNSGSMQPDFVWTKSRSDVESHRLHDSVRGGNGTVLYELNSNETTAEGTDTLVSGFVSNGFTIESGGNSPNVTGRTYVGWQWQAGQGTNTSNTSGTITSTVSVNATAGFSVVTYTGNGTSGATVGHGLGVAPKLILIKRRQGTNNWAVAGSILGSASTLYLNLTNAMDTYTVALIGNIQTSTTFQLGNDGNRNESGGTFVAYCWAEIAGFSQFGSYTGNGSTDGPFVYTGFRPKFVVVKNLNDPNDWFVIDSVRNAYNIGDALLRPNDSVAEVAGGSSNGLDLLSNGFKVRSSFNWGNRSGDTIVYMVFAENPFKNSNAR